MLLTQFLLINTHFVLSVATGLVLFATSWLYFDALKAKRTAGDTASFLGFFALSLSFIFQSAIIDQDLLVKPLLNPQILESLRIFLRTGGYLGVIVGQLAKPLQPLPSYRYGQKAALLLPALPALTFLPFAFPPLAALSAILYLRRATTGLEHHLKPPALSLFLLALSEVLGLGVFFRDSSSLVVSQAVAAYGPLWISERVILLLFALVLGRWIWSYLIKRFDTQLFMIFTASSLVIFLVTTIFFTYSILQNLQTAALSNLETNVKVLGYAVDNKKSEVLSDTLLFAQNPSLAAAFVTSDQRTLTTLAQSSLIAKKYSSLLLVSPAGQVLARAEDPEKIGHSISSDPFFIAAGRGETLSATSSRDGALAPTVTLKTSAPIKDNTGAILGVVLATVDIDSPFVDGLKAATGLDASVYASNIRSATTFVAEDGKSRWVGITEDTPAVTAKVLDQNAIYTGPVTILGTPYFAGFAPLTGPDHNPLGMIFVGRPQYTLLQTASSSIQLTFLTTIVLIMLSVIPAYVISKSISEQISA